MAAYTAALLYTYLKLFRIDLSLIYMRDNFNILIF